MRGIFVKRPLWLMLLLVITSAASLYLYRNAHTAEEPYRRPELPRWKYPKDVPVTSPRAPGAAVTRVLMIGNSYTFYHGMPWLLQAFSDGDAKPFEVTVLAYPNLGFSEHRGAGAEQFLRQKKWDFVVLQDYSLGPLMAVESFHADGAALVAEVKAVGAVPILYQTWSRESDLASQTILTEQYDTLAKQSGARVAPVGEAWLTLRKSAKPPALYDYDGSHPTLEGSYTAACVLYAAISGRSPRGLPGKVAPLIQKSRTWVMPDGVYDLPAETTAAIQAAADGALKTRAGK